MTWAVMALHPAIRAALLGLPPLRNLIAARDRLLLERNDSVAAGNRLRDERDRLAAACDRMAQERDRLLWDHRFVPPGHFYSPIPALDEVARDAGRIFADPPRVLPGIDMREEVRAQLGSLLPDQLLERFVRFYEEMPFTPEPDPTLRYRFDNGAYSYFDAIALYCMIRHLQPARIVEIGSGHSSCITLDTNESFFADRIETVFVEPYPKTLRALIRPEDAARVQIVETRLQDVPAALFATLGENDILFIDSTHVGKIGSDVSLLFAEILPALRPGVCVAFHDIFYPFEYPRYWIEAGRAWNEAYMLRCFLQYNSRFRIELMTDYLARFHAEFLRRHMPLCLENPGASLWLRAG